MAVGRPGGRGGQRRGDVADRGDLQGVVHRRTDPRAQRVCRPHLGAVTWLIGVFYKSLYAGGLINGLTVFAAFTALLVFLGGITGVTVGRYSIDRAGAYTPHRGGGGEEERADTAV